MWTAGDGNRVGCGWRSQFRGIRVTAPESCSAGKACLSREAAGTHRSLTSACMHRADSKGSVSQEECVARAPRRSVCDVSWDFSPGHYNRSVGSNFRWGTGSGTGQIHRRMSTAAGHWAVLAISSLPSTALHYTCFLLTKKLRFDLYF